VSGRFERRPVALPRNHRARRGPERSLETAGWQLLARGYCLRWRLLTDRAQSWRARSRIRSRCVPTASGGHGCMRCARTLLGCDARSLQPLLAASALALLARPGASRRTASLASSSFHPRAQPAIAADGRSSLPPATTSLSPVVKYHGLGFLDWHRPDFWMRPQLNGATLDRRDL
jgi:hypothetical protein